MAAWLDDTAQAFEEIGEADLAIDWAEQAAQFNDGHQSLKNAVDDRRCRQSRLTRLAPETPPGPINRAYKQRYVRSVNLGTAHATAPIRPRPSRDSIPRPFAGDRRSLRILATALKDGCGAWSGTAPIGVTAPCCGSAPRLSGRGTGAWVEFRSSARNWW